MATPLTVSDFFSNKKKLTAEELEKQKAANPVNLQTGIEVIKQAKDRTKKQLDEIDEEMGPKPKKP